MPTRNWALGDEVLAEDFQELVQDQVVSTFPTAAVRGTDLPSPKVGQLSHVGNVSRALWLWNGTSWVEPASPRHASGVNLHTQCGQDLFVTNSAGGAVLTYPVPFAAVPVTVLIGDMGGGPALQMNFAVIEDQVTTLVAGFVVRDHLGDPVESGGIRLGWIAIGERAVDT